MIRGSGSEILNHAYPVVRKVDFRSEMDWKADMQQICQKRRIDPKLTSAITACRELERQAIQNESKKLRLLRLWVCVAARLSSRARRFGKPRR
jgi:hypothetical protein